MIDYWVISVKSVNIEGTFYKTYQHIDKLRFKKGRAQSNIKSFRKEVSRNFRRLL